MTGLAGTRGPNVASRNATARPSLTRAVWVATTLLVLVGVASAAARAFWVSDLVTRIEPLRQRVLERTYGDREFVTGRAVEVAFIDGRFAAHRFTTWAHVGAGALFLALAPLQFWKGLRTRHTRVHRWSGRALILLGVVFVLTGLYFGLFLPYGGVGEAVIIALAGGFFLVAVTLAWRAIRRRQVGRHREWMIRAFGAGIAISVVRVVAGPLDLGLAGLGWSTRSVFVLSLWLGWGLTLAAAELWIRRTRKV